MVNCDRCGVEMAKDYTTSIWCSWITGPEKIPPRYDLCRNCAYEFRAFLERKKGQKNEVDFRENIL